MGRKKSSDERQEKRTPIKVRPIPRKNAGRITEPWAIMERLIAEVPAFAPLKPAKIKLWWQRDWKADLDGIATGAQVCKASEIDRNLVEESSGETVDLFIKLPEQQWPMLDATEKEHRLFHELCHIRPAQDANGKQKRDAKDRLLWRLSRHPIVAFHEEIQRYGIDRVLGHNDRILEAIHYSDRPMEKLFDRSESNANGKPAPAAADDMSGWRDWDLCELIGLMQRDRSKSALRKACDGKGIRTLGELSDLMSQHGDWWPRELPGIGETIAHEVVTAFMVFWDQHPQLSPPGRITEPSGQA